MIAVLISILIAAAIRSIVFAGAIGLALKALRVRDARTRLAAWTAVLCAVLLMPLLSLWMPALALPVRHAVEKPELTLVQPALVSLPAVDIPSAARVALDWRSIAGLVYIAVTLIFIARLAYGLVLSSKLRRTATTIGDRETLNRLEAAAHSKLPALAESDVLIVPVTIGTLRPILLLPGSWREWSDAKLQAVLAHELSHIERRDYAILTIASLNRCLNWFNPLSWWLERHMRDLAEEASDDSAVRCTGDSAGYAEVLLGFMEALQEAPGRVRWEAVAMARTGRAGRRIDRILASGYLAGARRPAALAALAVLALPLLYLSAAVTTGEQSSSSIRTIANGARVQAKRPGSSQLIAQAQTTPASKPVERTIRVSDSQDSYVIVSPEGNTMSGTNSDLRRAKSFRYEVGEEYIWFRHDGKEYIVRDPATVKAARKLFGPQQELGQQQAELGAQQAKLGELQAKLGEQQRAIRTTMPDFSRDIERLKERMRSARTSEELGDVHALLGDLQAKVAEQQAKIGNQQGKLGEQQALLGEQLAELGSRQGKLGEQQERLAEEASEKLKKLLDEALKKGIAQSHPQ